MENLFWNSSLAMHRPRPAGLGFVVMATTVTAIGGFLFGYDTAVISGAISYLKAHMGLDAAQEGMAGAKRDPGLHPRGDVRGVPLRSVRSQEDALPPCRALRGFRHSLRSTPNTVQWKMGKIAASPCQTVSPLMVT